ncbi:MAG: hypothetical protein K0S38_277 [Candidatus Paceibacter sp.]|nr:hypothetical protein [Candidatus Paceibacter sp.]
MLKRLMSFEWSALFLIFAILIVFLVLPGLAAIGYSMKEYDQATRDAKLKAEIAQPSTQPIELAKQD